MRIREARAEDIEAAASFLLQTQDAHVRAHPDRYVPISLADAIDSLRPRIGGGRFWVATDGNGVLGYAIAEFMQVEGNRVLRAREYCYLQQIAVATCSRGQGVGKLLVEHVQQECEKRGIKNIELDVWVFNSDARQFFQACGFEPYASKLRLSRPE